MKLESCVTFFFSEFALLCIRNSASTAQTLAGRVEICTFQIQKPPRRSEGEATLGITQHPFLDPSDIEQYPRLHSTGT